MVENEEASASVVVKMTDSFTEQADQVIPEKAPHLPRHCGRETLGRWGGGVVSTGDVFQLVFSIYESHLCSLREIWKT